MVSEEIILFYFSSFFAFWLTLQPIDMSSEPQHRADRRLLKKHFYDSFVKIPANA